MMRRIALLARLALPRGVERFYLRRLRASGLFDAAFYRAENPDLHPLFRRRPDLHYIIAGEAEGRRPRRDFVPSDYLRLNPDLGEWAARPFLHYVLHGADEHRRTRDIPAPASGLTCALPVLRRERGREGGAAPQAEVAVVVHLHYRNLWDEFAEALAIAALEADLFVTLSHRPGDLPDDPPPPDSGDADPDADEAPAAETLAAQIRETVPGARVIVMPNHGRDVFPFVHLVNSGLLDGYRAVCKLHTKRSPHRRDGDAWRRHLVAGVLPGAATAAALERFLADPEAGLWVADGQHYTEARWWGSNREGVARLCRRVGVLPDHGALSFPAGSIYWLKPAMITLIRGLRLRIEDFEPEAGQLDGTTAHAFERTLGYLAGAAGLAIRQSAEVMAAPLPPALPPALPAASAAPAAPALPTLVSAFYLPQFHRCPENDAWWGRGFTEWTAAACARPVLDGHDQPALPGELGFYDLSRPEAMAEQAALAAEHGIDAFCVYHYWFGGRRLLERPMETLLSRPDIAFPFYLCWANESWRRNWDGLSGEVLAGQDYAPGFEAALAADLARFMEDPRYLRPDGVRPRLVIYRPEDLPEPAANLARLRAAFRDLGMGEIELGAVRFHVAGANSVPEGAVDFWVEMPPHGLVGAADYLFGGPGGNRLGFEPRPGFRGLVYDYARVVANSLSPAHAASLPASTIAGVMPSWDNTARRGLAAHLAYGAHPAAFSGWLHGLGPSGRLAGSYRGEVMVNAWNEWAERAVLEPCTTWGRAWLEVLRDWRAGVPAPAFGGTVPAPAVGGTVPAPAVGGTVPAPAVGGTVPAPAVAADPAPAPAAPDLPAEAPAETPAETPAGTPPAAAPAAAG